jgi:hypothetical protein
VDVVAKRDGQLLIDLGNGKGAIRDSETGLIGKPMDIASLWARGYWTPIPPSDEPEAPLHDPDPGVE